MAIPQESRFLVRPFREELVDANLWLCGIGPASAEAHPAEIEQIEKILDGAGTEDPHADVVLDVVTVDEVEAHQ